MWSAGPGWGSLAAGLDRATSDGLVDSRGQRRATRLARSPFVCRDAPLFFSTIYDKENWKCSKSGDAGVPGLRARRVRAQLGFGGVLELCGSESALPVLF